MNSTPLRHVIFAYAKIITNPEHSVALQREAILQLEQALKDEKEFMDKPKTATECVGYIPPRPTPEKDLYIEMLRLLQAQSDTNLPASARLAAYDELQTVMYREKYKFERAADIERKEAMLTRAVSVSELEAKLDEFLKDRQHYRTRTSMGGLGGTNRDDQDFCHLFKNFLRHSLKLPTL